MSTRPEKVLRVNLTHQTITSEEIPASWLKWFIGGKGLGAAYLYSELEKDVDPLSPENKLLFMLGPLVGVTPGCSRFCVMTKSPLTGTFLDSYSGGHFPAFLRFGIPEYMGIIVEGKAERPCYLKIENNSWELKSASHLEGKKVSQVCDSFENYKVATIGPGGENLVKYATIANDNGNHHAGRGGAGAVMGSKNLKAVVVNGQSFKVPEVDELRKEHMKWLATGEGPEWARDGGTPQVIDSTNETGTLPTRNWTKGSFDQIENIGMDEVRRNEKNRTACYLCPVACGFNLKFKQGAFKGFETGWGPEYESMALNGPITEISDLSAIAKIADVCDEFGIDTISAGNVLGWTMECAQKGLIDYELDFGDYKGALDLLEKIAYREGIGDTLAEGTRYAGEKVGGEAREAAVEVKGMELPGYEPRGSFSMALAYATSDRGACHNRAWPIGSDALGGDRDPFDVKGHAQVIVEDQDENSLKWSLISCATAGFPREKIAPWLNGLGYDVKTSELDLIGERIWNLVRLFNVREGFDREDDTLPLRLTYPLGGEGPSKGKKITEEQFNGMLDEYYSKRGWNKKGIPTDEKIKELGLSSFGV